MLFNHSTEWKKKKYCMTLNKHVLWQYNQETNSPFPYLMSTKDNNKMTIYTKEWKKRARERQRERRRERESQFKKFPQLSQMSITWRNNHFSLYASSHNSD